jgi:HlyD family secretion protein
MHLRRTLTILGILVLVAALGYWWTRPKPVDVVLYRVDQGSVESTVANTRAGTVEACRRAELSLAVGGQIDSLPVSEGDSVEAGQVLLELWNDDLEAQLALAERNAQAAEARAEEACVLAEVAERDAQRLARLRKQGLSSEEQADNAAGKAQAQRAVCRASRASVQVAEAQIAVARANLARTILRAPFAGTIAKINGELFEFVTPSPIGVATPPAVDLIDDCCLYVTAPIDEVDAPAIRSGMEARISLDAFSGQRFPAQVRRVAPYVVDREKQARTVDVEVDFQATAALESLMPGYSADVEILLERRENVVRVPTEAVLEGPRVLVFEAAAGLVQARDVETGISNWRWTEVTGGLEAGEQIITSVDREGVVDGASVRAEGAP